MQYCKKCPDAVAIIRSGVELPQLSGCVKFFQENGRVLIMARILGLPKNCWAYLLFSSCYIPPGDGLHCYPAVSL